MFKITDRDLRNVVGKAAEAPHRRAHHFLTGDPGDGLQPFLLAMDPASYVRPHRHARPRRSELLAALTGEMLVVTFDELGGVKDHAVLRNRDGCRVVAVRAGDWHTILALRPGSAALDVKEGPHRPETDKTFAGWAPEEGTPEARAFRARLMRELIPARNGSRTIDPKG